MKRTLLVVILCTVTRLATADPLTAIKYHVDMGVTDGSLLLSVDDTNPLSILREFKHGPWTVSLQGTASIKSTTLLAIASNYTEVASSLPATGVEASTSFQVRVTTKTRPPVIITQVPVLTTAKVSVQCQVLQGPAEAEAGARISAGNAVAGQIFLLQAGCNQELSYDAFSLLWNVDVPTDIRMETSADGHAFLSLAAAFSLQAKADPSFQIDPAFPYADYFELEFSPGFDEVEPLPDPVPEPASVTMFAVGLGTLIARRIARPSLRSTRLDAS
jgi:hypothetical protein